MNNDNIWEHNVYQTLISFLINIQVLSITELNVVSIGKEFSTKERIFNNKVGSLKLFNNISR
uniref:Kinesin-like protein n=1 Tax=Moumouvirus sp. 'Monve' TaxID=1128131 RepID=H2EE12_9VIRU|nr:kinesin-like protein [Moumouvirus Monve]